MIHGQSAKSELGTWMYQPGHNDAIQEVMSADDELLWDAAVSTTHG